MRDRRELELVFLLLTASEQGQEKQTKRKMKLKKKMLTKHRLKTDKEKD